MLKNAGNAGVFAPSRFPRHRGFCMSPYAAEPPAILLLPLAGVDDTMKQKNKPIRAV